MEMHCRSFSRSFIELQDEDNPVSIYQPTIKHTFRSVTSETMRKEMALNNSVEILKNQMADLGESKRSIRIPAAPSPNTNFSTADKIQIKTNYFSQDD